MEENNNNNYNNSVYDDVHFDLLNSQNSNKININFKNLNILSFNINGDFTSKLKNIIKLSIKKNIKIICLQETKFTRD
ncbi:hypothetical protein DICPUDRAFT_155390 [Dictyostelium purpureum]|uniref:Endonuclease/exonuclease/phosphatase domain-containing protein n=1 Tax=Dictyostelium purpureum TaxID=5786 RepID=F0ZTV7_DICPU|nr:uncharacterized protein DICPUDRAFT_155390 [Dictyostelium purpureum]EGC32630.1 hypothetical protein DICPUDRAFT_155390 [Dictyostelium purpureum]|eukprot:XP_003290845.1 hypothetical protein DICPUDRAFT_155390 [Dictyostelium purpureum]